MLNQLPISVVRRWTDIAKACYLRGCVCQDCYYKEFFKDNRQGCRMKVTVVELVRVLGVPNELQDIKQIVINE